MTHGIHGIDCGIGPQRKNIQDLAGKGGRLDDHDRGSFADVLRSTLKLSGHASQRIKASGRPLSHAESRRLEDAVALAASKGCRDTLVLMGDRAFIVNVPNRTVVTAIDSDRMKENVFTNIDAAVIV